MKTEAMVQAALAPSDYLVVAPVVVCLLFGAMLLMIRKRIDWHPVLAIPGFFLVLLVDVLLLLKVAAEGPQTMMMGGWKAPFGIAFTVDMLGALFVTASGFVAFAAAIYASVSINRTERRYGFFPFLFLMMGGVSGAFLTGDVFNLYVWFEVLLIGSFGLLILGSEHEQLDGATKYCFLNLVATTLFLITTGYLYGLFGTLNMADIAEKAGGFENDGALLTIVVLFLVAFSAKAAAFPLNFWLPASYHTPRFVVSALFAGLLTKVGVYALIRIVLMLFPPQHAELAPLIAWVAALTMLVGAFGALAQSDLRRLLNYFVVAGIGTIFAGLALVGGEGAPDAGSLANAARAATADGAPDVVAGAAAPLLPATGNLVVGLSGAVFYALHSIVVMTALYLAAGTAARIAGSSSLRDMGGLWRGKPALAALMLVFLFAVSGLPPFSGFWPKVVLVRGAFQAGLPWLGAVILFTGFLMTVASARIFALAFWRNAPEPAVAGARGGSFDPEGEASPALSMTPLLILAVFIVAAGVLPQWLATLTDIAARGVVDPAAYLGSVFGGAS
ncbi:monovalent cation/H+ antiporter subunit D [Aurantimonas sp. 22II-16-19i]|nr:monovalent cation/H+ antiporter subunit D [Aurantimonas sp. 22II-16-19i]